jgi:hypothetical protein
MTRFCRGKMSGLRSEGAQRERKRGKQERECGLLHRVVTDENRRRTARITARNSSSMATSIGEERKIERKSRGWIGEGFKRRGHYWGSNSQAVSVYRERGRRGSWAGSGWFGWSGPRARPRLGWPLPFLFF